MNRIVHLALKVEDLEKTTEFYQDVFGFREVETRKTRDHLSRHLTDGAIDFTLIKYDDGTQSAESKASGEGPCIHHFAIEVEVSHKVSVMYAGRMVESGSVHDVVRNPRHPYTEGLMRSTVHEVAKGERLTPIPGSPPNLAALPPGCSFAPRCRYADARCRGAYPPPVTIGLHGRYEHVTRCLYPDRVQREPDMEYAP